MNGQTPPRPRPEPPPSSHEYLVVSDHNSEVVLSTNDLNAARRVLGTVTKCGGSATIFKALKF